MGDFEKRPYIVGVAEEDPSIYRARLEGLEGEERFDGVRVLAYSPEEAITIVQRGEGGDSLTLGRQVGGVAPAETTDPLVVLLYLLMRDHLGTGIIEKLVTEMGEIDNGSVPMTLTNPYLAAYAENIAERLRTEGGEKS